MKQFGWELRKLIKRNDVRIGFVIIILASVLALLGAALGLRPEIENVRERVELGLDARPLEYQRGVGFAIKTFETIIVPLILIIASVVMASSITEESRDGALSRLLRGGVNRAGIIFAKFGAGVTYVAALVLVALIFNLFIPSMVLGGGSLQVGKPTQEKIMQGGMVIGSKPVIPKVTGGTAKMRVTWVYLISIIGLAPVVALGLLASAASRKTTTALVGALGITFAVWTLGTTTLMGGLRRYFSIFGNNLWNAFLQESISVKDIAISFVLPAIALLLFLGSSIMVINGREAPPSN